MVKFKNTNISLDILIAILGLVGSLIAFVLMLMFLSESSIYRYIEAPIFCIIACGLYLILNKKWNKTNIFVKFHEFTNSTNLILVINIIFFVAIAYIALIMNSQQYSRPIEFFILIPIIVCCIAIEVLYLPKNKMYIYVLFFKLFLIHMLLRLSPQLITDGFIGIDPWWHEMFTNQLLTLSNIPQASSYTDLPAMHLLVSFCMILGHLSYKIVVMDLFPIIQFTSYLFIYLLSKLIYNEKIGLMAILILTVSNMQIQYSIVVIPMTLATIIITMSIYLLFRSAVNNNNSIYLRAILLIFYFLIVMTHALGSVISIVLIICTFVFFELYKKQYKISSKNPVSRTTIFLFIIIMFSWWMYVAQHYLIAFVTLFEKGMSSTLGGFSIKLSNDVSIDSKIELLLSIFGFFLGIGLSIFGSLCMLSNKYVNRNSFSIVFSGYALTAIVFGSLLLGLVGLLPGRWYVILQIVLVIPAALGIYVLSLSFKDRYKQIISLIVLISILTFFMITDPVANTDTPIYSKNSTIRLNFKDSELSSINTISNINANNKTILTDQFPMYYVQYTIKNKRSKSFTDLLLNKNFTTAKNDTIIVRQEILDHPFGAYSNGITRLDYNLPQLLNEYEYSKIFNSSTVQAYVQ